jgi:hypothetical protein
MTLQVLFWILMLFWLIFGLWREYTPGQPYPFIRGVGSVLTFILLGILGWQVFGAPIHH